MTAPHPPTKNGQTGPTAALRGVAASVVAPVDALARSSIPSNSGGSSAEPKSPGSYDHGHVNGNIAGHECPSGLGQPNEATLGEPLSPVRLAIPSDPRCLRMVRDLVCRFSQLLGFAEETRFQLQLAVDEALTNVIRHCYYDQHDCPIEVTLAAATVREQPALRVEIRDFGQHVDAAAFRGRELDDPRPGGLGVHIIRTVMDEVAYDPVKGGGMRLLMTKIVPSSATQPSVGSLSPAD